MVDYLLSDGVVSPCVVIGSVLLPGDELFRVKKLPVGPGPDLVNDRALQIHEDGPGDVLPRSTFGEKSGQVGIIGSPGEYLAVRGDAVLQAVELPARVTDLATRLADMDANNLSHLQKIQKLKLSA